MVENYEASTMYLSGRNIKPVEQDNSKYYGEAAAIVMEGKIQIPIYSKVGEGCSHVFPQPASEKIFANIQTERKEVPAATIDMACHK